jgi:hypothetical protein
MWRAATHAAAGQPDHEIKLARLASKWNLAIESEELWSNLSRNPPTRREALDALQKLYRANNDLRKLYDVLQRLHEISPNEIAIAAGLARLGLNIDQNTKQAQELAKQAYDHAPQDWNCAITYAFSLYVQGRTTEGLEVLKKLPPDALRDPHNAVYAAVLLLDLNQGDAAREYIQSAKRGQLYSEEKRLLEDERAKIPGASPSPAAAPTPTQTPTPRPVPSRVGGSTSTPQSSPSVAPGP